MRTEIDYNAAQSLLPGLKTASPSKCHKDLLDPQNWPPWRKWTAMAIASFVELLTSAHRTKRDPKKTLTCHSHIASMMFAPGISDMKKSFGRHDDMLATLAMTIYVIGFGVGPLLFAPLSEIFGRPPIYRCCVLMFLSLTVGCAMSSSIDVLITFRFFAGCFGAAPIAIGGAIVADLLLMERRGTAMAIYQMGPILGNLLGPPLGGVIVQQMGWRRAFWTTAVMAAIATTSSIFLLPETHGPTIRLRRADKHRLRGSMAEADNEGPTNPRTATTVRQALKMPFKLLITSPVILCTSIMIAVQSDLQNFVFASLGSVFQHHYGMTSSKSGFVHLAVAAGFVVAAITFGKISDRVSDLVAQRMHKDTQPESRLLPATLGVPIRSAGLLWFGWSVQNHQPWMIALLGLFLVGIGMTTVQTYLVDCFPEFAASVLAASTVARSIGGSFIPLAAPALYKAVGAGWGNTVVSAISSTTCAIVVVLLYFGERLRRSHPVEFI